MKHLLFILLFIGNGFILFAQKDSVLVRYRLLDQVHEEVIPNVQGTFVLTSKTIYKQSNQKGIIALKVAKLNEIQAAFSHPLFTTVQLKYSLNSVKDTLDIVVKMEPNKVTDLKSITVKPLGTPYTVYGSNVLNVADFEILKDGQLVLLAYKKQLKKG